MLVKTLDLTQLALVKLEFRHLAIPISQSELTEEGERASDRQKEGEYESKVQQKLPVPTEYLSPQLRCCHWAAFLLVTQGLGAGRSVFWI